MARIRTIKPDFFLDEDLDQLSEVHQKLFIGLWTLADSEGKLADQPRKIRAQIFPYRPAYNVEGLLWDLDAADFIHRYEVDGVAYILICQFRKHQRPHPKELSNGFPNPKSREKKRQAVKRPVESPQQSPQEGKESLILDTGLLDTGGGDRNPPPLELTGEPEPKPRKRSEGQVFWDWCQSERSRVTGLLTEAEVDPPALNAWFKRALSEITPERLKRAWARYVLKPQDKFWVEKGFPFQGFMSESVWRRYTPASEAA